MTRLKHFLAELVAALSVIERSPHLPASAAGRASGLGYCRSRHDGDRQPLDVDLAEFEISSDPSRVDVSLVHDFLTQSYWAHGRSRDLVERSIRHSLCFGAYHAGRQIAFARVITDRAVFAYLADVFVVPAFRGRGVAKALMQAILDHSDLRDLRVFMLATRDAHGLYAQFGFRPLLEPERLMCRCEQEADQPDSNAWKR